MLFILLLGFAAAKSRGFDAHQTSGFGSLVVKYTLPAGLFVAIIKASRSALLDDWQFLLLIVVTFSLMFGVGYGVARKVFHRSPGEAAIAGLLVGSPGVPFFGTTILGPLFGASSTVTVALVSIVVNVLQVPAATVLLVSSAASQAPESAPATPPTGGSGGVLTAPPAAAPVDTRSVVLTALRKPMVVAPVLAFALVLVGVHVPSLIDAMLTPLGQATSGVAVFVAGLTLGQQKLSLSWEVGWNVAAKMLLMPAVVFALVLGFGLTGTGAKEVVVSSAIMSTTIAVILAGHYKTYMREASSTLLLTAVSMFVVLPVALSAVSVVHQ